jgi:hypothetical protein
MTNVESSLFNGVLEVAFMELALLLLAVSFVAGVVAVDAFVLVDESVVVVVVDPELLPHAVKPTARTRQAKAR